MNIFQNILPYGVFGKSRAINAENPTGEKGKGGMASSNLLYLRIFQDVE